MLNENVNQVEKFMQKNVEIKMPYWTPKKICNKFTIWNIDQARKECKGGCKWPRLNGPKTSKFKRAMYKHVSTTFMAIIIAIVTKYGTNFDVNHYLWTGYKSPTRVTSSYENLIKINLWTWFISKGELNLNHIQAHQQGTIVKL